MNKGFNETVKCHQHHNLYGFAFIFLHRTWDLTSFRPARQQTTLTAKPCPSGRAPSLHAPTWRGSWTSSLTVRGNADILHTPHSQHRLHQRNAFLEQLIPVIKYVSLSTYNESVNEI